MDLLRNTANATRQERDLEGKALEHRVWVVFDERRHDGQPPLALEILDGLLVAPVGEHLGWEWPALAASTNDLLAVLTIDVRPPAEDRDRQVFDLADIARPHQAIDRVEKDEKALPKLLAAEEDEFSRIGL